MSEELKNTEMTEETAEQVTESVVEETAAEEQVETAEALRPRTDNDEIKEFQKEVLGKLDSPLVVHKKSDASFEDDGAAFDMEMTHNEEAKPTLERHRFKKDPKSKGSGVLTVLIILVIIACVFAGLYFTGHLPFGKNEDAVSETETVAEETTSIEEKYTGTIVVKDTAIFVDGYEVDGIAGLQDALKYLDASPTAYTIINEHADSDFLNYDVYPILTDLGFFGDKTVVEVREKTGLMTAEEIAEAEAATATQAETEAPTEAATEAATEAVSE